MSVVIPQLNSQPLGDDSNVDNRFSRVIFLQRVLIIVGVVTATGLLLTLVWSGIQVILLVFAGLLLAVFLQGLGSWVEKHSPLSINWALGTVLLVIVAVITLATWLLASSVQQEYAQLTESLPQAIEKMRGQIAEYGFGRWMLGQLPQTPDQLFANQSSNVFGRITGFFSNFLSILANALIFLAVGIYFAFNPKLYCEGVTKLFPASRQKRVREVLATLGITLHNWLLGRIAIMAANGALTAAALWLLGVPLAIPLGILTGILNFIPNVGPILAAVPAVLLALTNSPTQALYVVILFLIIQNLEGFVLTPLVQQQTIQLPPVLVLAAQLLLGILFGFFGILLAVPIVAVVFVLVKMIYVEDTLGNQVEVQGEKRAKQQTQTNAAA